jgi:hypothetical protein
MPAAPAAAPRFRLRVEAVQDACARPALLLALEDRVPDGAVRGPSDRRRAVADGVVRALLLAQRVETGQTPDQRDRALLDEAEGRLWDPVDAELARVLRSAGPDGLLAVLVLEGAVRREAWRGDAERRRGSRAVPLDDGLPVPDERDPVDLAAFRADVERAALRTTARTGLPPGLAASVVAREVSFAEAARAANRSPNALWMALARLRPEWDAVARRGREAGLGGGALVDVADRADRVARRVVRWRLVGGLVAALLLATTAGALAGATLLTGSSPPPRVAEPAPEPAVDDGAFGTARRLARLEALRRVAPVAPVAAPAERRVRSADAAASAPAASDAADAGVPAAAPTPDAPADAGCGLGTADLACR